MCCRSTAHRLTRSYLQHTGTHSASCASDSMFYPSTLCTLQIVFMIMIKSLSVPWCTSGCVVECRTCNREDAGLNLGRIYFAPRSTQPSVPPGSVNEYRYQLRLGRQRHLQLIKCWPSCATWKGVCGGAKIFGSTLLQPARSVCVSLGAFFIM